MGMKACCVSTTSFALLAASVVGQVQQDLEDEKSLLQTNKMHQNPVPALHDFCGDRCDYTAGCAAAKSEDPKFIEDSLCELLCSDRTLEERCGLKSSFSQREEEHALIQIQHRSH